MGPQITVALICLLDVVPTGTENYLVILIDSQTLYKALRLILSLLYDNLISDQLKIS